MSYPKVWNISHKSVRLFLDDPNIALRFEEKVDGSQVSFGMKDGKPWLRSKNCDVNFDQPNQFAAAVRSVQHFYENGCMPEGYTFRGEYLSKPRHNVLAYDKVPQWNIVLFDVNMPGDGSVYLAHNEVRDWAVRLGCDSVRIFGWKNKGDALSLEMLKHYAAQPSFLGGECEGVVMKPEPPDRFCQYTGQLLIAKWVKPQFREQANGKAKKENVGMAEFVAGLVEEFRTPARFDKAVQHCRDRGELEGEMRDMPKLLKEVATDFIDEYQSEIANRLWRLVVKQHRLVSRVQNGLAEHYKGVLEKEVLSGARNVGTPVLFDKPAPTPGTE